MEGFVKSRLLGVTLAGALAAGCGMVGNEEERHEAVIAAICLDCHNAAEAVGGLNLEPLSLDAVPADAETWEKVIRKLHAGLMPPADGPSLDPETRGALVAWLRSSTV
jgi:hypothetical protein